MLSLEILDDISFKVILSFPRISGIPSSTRQRNACGARWADASRISDNTSTSSDTLFFFEDDNLRPDRAETVNAETTHPLYAMKLQRRNKSKYITMILSLLIVAIG
jgi:hypothetical protein